MDVRLHEALAHRAFTGHNWSQTVRQCLQAQTLQTVLDPERDPLCRLLHPSRHQWLRLPRGYR